jgi:hypothetical protein
LLDEGFGVPEISRQLGVLASTLHKAIAHGRLRGNKKKSLAPMRGPKAALKPSGW